MSFTTYREQQSHNVSSHVRSSVLDSSARAEQNYYVAAKRSQRYSKALDVCLVALWGVSIPGLMWLGAYSGL
ncbi:MAG: hypothetical protein ACTJHW_14120 [Paenalcaligenes sp.]